MSSEDESESLNVNPTSAMCMEVTTGPGPVVNSMHP